VGKITQGVAFFVRGVLKIIFDILQKLCGGDVGREAKKKPRHDTGAKERKITMQGANRRLGEAVWHPNQDRTQACHTVMQSALNSA
jgi:hypothetical protein